MHPDHGTTDDQAAHQGAVVFCVRSGGEPEDWHLEQVHSLGALEWAPQGQPDDAGWLDQAVQAVAEEGRGRPVHVLASGRTVPRALMLATQRPDLVISILAADPEVDEDDPAYWDLLRRVQTPTLVVVAAPQRDSDISQAQTVAGGVDNGVMVIVDGCRPPVHREAPHSFHEWVTAFMSIAEGLQTLTPQPQEEAHA